MNPKRFNFAFWRPRSFAAGLTFSACLASVLIGCEQHRPAEVSEFPDGFHGWAVIVWGVSGYPPLPTDHGKLIERFPADGVIITSSTQSFGFANDEAYFITATGHRSPLRPNIAFGAVGNIQSGGLSMDYFQQFVGTDVELEKAPMDAPQLEILFSRFASTRTSTPKRDSFTNSTPNHK